MSYQDPTVSQASYLRQPLYAQPPQQYSDEYSGGYAPSAPPAPVPAPVPPPSSGSKFTASGYRDLAWAILFLVHLVAYLGGGGYFLNKYRDELITPTVSSNTTAPSSSPYSYSGEWDQAGLAATSTGVAGSTDDHIRLQRDAIMLGLSSLGISALIALMWLSLVKSYARTMIWASLVADVAVSILLVFICLAYGAMGGAVIFALFAALKVVWVYWMRSRIQFAAVILEHSVRCIQTWPATIGAAFLSLVLQSAWLVGWGFCTVGYYYAVTRTSDANSASNTNANGTQGQMQQDNTVSYLVVFLMLVSFYWTSQVVKNLLHVTVGGVAATWYFLVGSGQEVKNPTWGSFKRAATTSFGSICLGSLVLSVVRAMRVVVSIMAQQPGNPRNGGAAAARACFYCIGQCLLSILDRVVEYCNQWAFAYVAIYGKSYCEAARNVWELFKARGFDAIINDLLIGIALGFACIMGGLTSAAVCGVLSHVVYTGAGDWVTWALLGFIVGFALTMIATEVVESAVTALFVCLAEDPAAMQRTKPEVYAQIVPAIQARYPRVVLVPVPF